MNRIWSVKRSEENRSLQCRQIISTLEFAIIQLYYPRNIYSDLALIKSIIYSEYKSQETRLFVSTFICRTHMKQEIRKSYFYEPSISILQFYIRLGEYTSCLKNVSKLKQHIRGAFNKFPYIFLYWHLQLSLTLENSLCYCYTSYEMAD